MIVVDGSSSDGTFQVVRDEFLVVSEPFDVAQGKLRESNPPAVSCYQTAFKDRALQMNVGVFEARSDVFLFVHADMTLPANAVFTVRERIKQGFVGGGFKKCYSTNNWVLKIYCFLTNLFFFWISKSLVGTNAIFVRRDIFEKIGGFEQGSFMEDVVFAEALKKIGRVTLIQDAVKVSPRRYEEKGVFRQIAKNAEIFFRYRFLHQNPSNLREIYEI